MRGKIVTGLVVLIQLTTWCCGGEPPTIDASRRMPTVYAKEGRTAKLTCPVRSVERFTTVKWYKDGEQQNLDDQPSMKNQVRDGVYNTLRIKPVQKSHSALYTCEVANNFGWAAENITLKVIDANGTIPVLPTTPSRDVPPMWGAAVTHNPGSVIELQEGDTLKLNCDATGVPTPQIQWYLQGMPFQDNTLNKLLDGYRLNHPMMKEDFEGEYKCVVRNDAGTLERFWEVKVHKDETKSELVMSPINNTVRSGDTASFKCTVVSGSPPDVMWLKEAAPGVTPYYTVQRRHYVLLQGAKRARRLRPRPAQSRPRGDPSTAHPRDVYVDVLSIENVQQSNSGHYMCGTRGDLQFAFEGASLTVLPASVTPAILPPAGPASKSSASPPVVAQNSTFNTPSGTLVILIVIPPVVVITICILVTYCVRRHQAAKRLRLRALQKNGLSLAKYGGGGGGQGQDRAEVMTPLTAMTTVPNGCPSANGVVSNGHANHHSNYGGKFSSLNSTYSGGSGGSSRRHHSQSAQPQGAVGSGEIATATNYSDHSTHKAALTGTSVTAPHVQQHMSNHSDSSGGYDGNMHLYSAMTPYHPQLQHQTSASMAAAYNDLMETDSHFSSISTSRYDHGSRGGFRPPMPVIDMLPSPYESTDLYSPPRAPPGSSCSNWSTSVKVI